MMIDVTTTKIPDAGDIPSFRARLEPSGSENGTVFMSGAFDGYELDRIRDKALYGVGSVRINVDGLARGEAESRVASHLAALVKRGVKIFVSVQ